MLNYRDGGFQQASYNFLYIYGPSFVMLQAADKQLFTLVEWARRIPHFIELPVDDQVRLIRAGEFKPTSTPKLD